MWFATNGSHRIVADAKHLDDSKLDSDRRANPELFLDPNDAANFRESSSVDPS